MPAVEADSASSIAQILLAEFENQAPVTRRFLERLPEDKLSWKPHEKSMTAGQLAYHLATTPVGIVRLVQNNPAQTSGRFSFPQPATLAEVLQAHDEGVTMVREILPSFDDTAMKENWRLMAGEKERMNAPRVGFIRHIMFNHWYQHRGQFSVYLRLLNIAVPASWGPSADEPPSAM